MSNHGKNNWEEIRQSLERDDQLHILQFFDELNDEQRAIFHGQLSKFDLQKIRMEVLGTHGKCGKNISIKPISCICSPKSSGDEQRWLHAKQKGEDALRAGKVAAVTFCGGRGNAIGFPRARGILPISPVKHKSLFQLFAESIRAVEIRYERPIHWILFTHGNCYREVVDFFDENRSFGLKNVHIFQQNSLPMITPSGQFILDSKYSIAQGPDGSGELLRLFCGNDSIAEMLRGRGVEYLTYFHIDNPLAQPFDLPSIGFIEIAQAQVSSRCAHKLYADERVDVFAEVNGCTSVIEHDNLPLECVGAMDISNRLRFGLANVDMHLFRMDFLQSLCSNEQWEGLRLRMQPTRIPFVNEKGMLVRPQAANAVQLTHNISDILPFAQKVLLVSGVREEIFSPVRNVAGINSAQTAKRDLVRRFASWLSRGKAELPVDDNGVCPFSIEISPLFALSEEEFLEKWSKLNPKPAACENFYIE